MRGDSYELDDGDGFTGMYLFSNSSSYSYSIYIVFMCQSNLNEVVFFFFKDVTRNVINLNRI